MFKWIPKKRRATQRYETAAVGLLVLGGAFLIVPSFLGGAAGASALSALRPLGLLLGVVGGALKGLGRMAARRLALHEGQAYRAAGPFEKMGPFFNSEVAAHLAAAELALNRARPRPSSWSSDVFEIIRWERLEAVVEALFLQAGFKTESRSHGAGGGMDVWLYSRHQPGAPVSLVHCGHGPGKPIGVEGIRDMLGMMMAQSVMRGQYVTTSTYTEEAVAFARNHGINLLDANGLLALIGRRTPEQQQALLDLALEGAS